MAANVPFDVSLTLRAGSVYYFADRALTSPEPHFFVVVNREPLGRELLLLSVITSQVEKVHRVRRHLPGTVVDLSPVLYDELSKPSVIDGNTLFAKSLEEFVQLFTSGRIRHHKDLPAELLETVRSAIHASPLISPEERELI
jgi:hypothetical protein